MLESAENAKRFAVAVEKAIADIKAKKLFRPYKNLQQFLMEQCGWKSEAAQQVIKFIEVKAALPSKSEPLVRTEWVARALSSVPEAMTIIEIRPYRKTDSPTRRQRPVDVAGFLRRAQAAQCSPISTGAVNRKL